jgi:hypothetical protein
MEGHAEMDMSVTEGGSLWPRLTSERGLTAISHYFVMDWVSVWMDIVGGLLITGALAAWVPAEFWRSFFLVDHPLVVKLWGPIVGPLVAVISFVCSVGNIPLAVLWNGGISFGGVIAFIFADLIVLPILNIYRKYYGLKMAALLFVSFYAAMAGAALIVELIFGAVALVPVQRNARVVEASIAWGYTTWLNFAFSHSRTMAGLAVPENGRPRDVAHDERNSGSLTGCRIGKRERRRQRKYVSNSGLCFPGLQEHSYHGRRTLAIGANTGAHRLPSAGARDTARFDLGTIHGPPTVLKSK